MNNSNIIGQRCREDFLSICPEAALQQLNFAENVGKDMYETVYYNDQKIHIVSARCGFGKGTVQKTFLNHILDDDISFMKDDWGIERSIGVIYITDRIERLQEIQKYGAISENSYMLRSEAELSLKEQFTEQQYYPILLMTTQRYFQMRPSEIRALKKWKDEYAEYERQIVIFDEMPQLTNSFDLDTAILNRVEQELMALPEEIEKNEAEQGLMALPEEEAKNEIIDCFQKLKKEIYEEWEWHTDLLKKSKMKHYTWVKPATDKGTITEFSNLIKGIHLSNMTQLVIEAIKKYKKEGCLYDNSRNKDGQNRKYSILINNCEKFLIDEFSYWIFDATAHEDVEYKLLLNKLPIEYYPVNDRKQEKCCVKLINCNTSLNKMKKSRQKELLPYIMDNSDAVIITYKTVETFIHKVLPKCNTLHFGNTKGNNSFRHTDHLLHIGLNRQSDIEYFKLYLELYPEEKDRLNKKDPDEIIQYITQITSMASGLFVNEMLNDIMFSKLAIDLEQNIFRTKLRNFSNEAEVQIEIVCSKQYHPVLDNVFEKYGISYDIEEDMLKKDRVREGTYADRILKYLESLSYGTEFTTKDIYEATGLTKKQFDKACKTHGIRENLRMWRVGRGKYVKRY